MGRSTFHEPLPENLEPDMAVSYKREKGLYKPESFEFISNFGPAGARWAVRQAAAVSGLTILFLVVEKNSVPYSSSALLLILLLIEGRYATGRSSPPCPVSPRPPPTGQPGSAPPGRP
jgi:hypothetical protein